MSGAPPPPAFPGAGGTAAGALKGLDRSIKEVCKRLPGVLPLKCFNPPAGAHWPGGQAVLTKAGPSPNDGASVDATTVERLLTAIAALWLGDDAKGRAAIGTTTIRDFRKMSAPQQLQFINRIWNAVSTTHAFDTKTEGMFEPTEGTEDGKKPLPSSWCPVTPGATKYHKRLGGSPFRELGVGFRVDGSNMGSIERVLKNGMTQQRLNDAFMKGHRGQNLTGTVAYDQSMARVWTLNHDIFNETGVCVSRNFFGGTAFPERETDNSGSEFCALWAVDCSGLSGFDTENHQTGLPGSRQWRPGEKAYSSIPKDRLLGWVKIQKRGAPATGGWKVDIATDAAWNFVGTPNVKQRAYMIDELDAWRGRHTIPAAFDFANQ